MRVRWKSCKSSLIIIWSIYSLNPYSCIQKNCTMYRDETLEKHATFRGRSPLNFSPCYSTLKIIYILYILKVEDTCCIIFPIMSFFSKVSHRWFLTRQQVQIIEWQLCSLFSIFTTRFIEWYYALFSLFFTTRFSEFWWGISNHRTRLRGDVEKS